MAEALKEADDNADWPELVIAVLKKAPKMPLELVHAAGDALRLLMDAETEGQHADFLALNPSVPAYLLIARGVVTGELRELRISLLRGRD